MKYRRIKLSEVEMGGLQASELTHQLIVNSDYVFEVTRDDGTPVLIFGTYPPTVMSAMRIVWLVPYESIHPRDFFGMRALFTKVREYTPHLRAIVRHDQPKAVQLVKLLRGKYIGEWAEGEGMYEWLA